MAGIQGTRGPADGITPQRTIEIQFDIEDYVLSRPAWSVVRLYSEVAPAAARDKAIDSASATNLYHWASGCWTLRPKQLRPWQAQEKQLNVLVWSGTPDSAAMGSQRPMYRNFSESGASPGSDNASDGNDTFFQKIIEAGADWASGVLSSPAAVAAHTALLLDPPDVLGDVQPKGTQPLDLILVPKNEAPPNQPISVRWMVPGFGNLGYQYLGTVHFGQYNLSICGDGMAELWEYTKKKGAAEKTWQKRCSFRYCRPELVAGYSHSLIIFPHTGLKNEKYVSFASAQMDAPGTAAAGLLSSPQVGGGAGSLTSGEYLWRWDEVLTNSEDVTEETYPGESQSISTIGGPVQLVERRDLRGMWQVGPVEWESAGLLNDLSASQPNPTSGPISGQYYYQERATGGGASSLIANLLDATDGTPWGGTGDAPNPIRAQFEFRVSPDFYETPVLWGYRLFRPGVYSLMAPGPFATNYDSQEKLSIRQGTRDLATEGADFRVDDLADAYTRLRTRGELPLRIVTSFQPPEGDPVVLKLLRGYAISPHRTRIGKEDMTYGIGSGGSERAYPSPEWSRYQVTSVSMWHRLKAECTTMKTALSLRDFFIDPDDAQKRSWKVTAAISYLLQSAGFPTSMISLPDLDVRLNPGVGGEQSDLVIDQSIGIGEVVVRLARMYLGRYLIFDANAGTHGKWKLVGAPTDATPRVNFTRAAATPTGSSATLQLPLHPGGFPAGTVPILGKVESHIVPPEANHLWVCNKVDVFSGPGGIRLENNLHNYLSYKVPGSTVDPDPDSPHYLGGERLMVIADQALWAGAGGVAGGYDATQRVIDYTLLRLFRHICMARTVLTFTASLQPIYDATETAWRLPRFYDVCTYNGQTGWYIRSCSPDISFDHLQKATFQIERLEPYLVS